MSKQNNIEDADVVVDFRGGKDAAAKYRRRIKELQAENKRLTDEVEFWMSEGSPDEWPPENVKWHKLFRIAKASRTKDQEQEMARLATIIAWKCDERLQYERAEQLEAEKAGLARQLKIMMELKP